MAKTKFPGFPLDLLKFFDQLSKNNNRDWFTEHKPVFKKAQDEEITCPVRVLKNAEVKSLLQSGVVNLANINTPAELEGVSL